MVYASDGIYANGGRCQNQTLALVSLSIMARSVHHGLGRHMASLNADQASTALRLLWISFCIIPCSETTAKASISIMLMRITTRPKWKRFFVSLIVLMVMITIAKFFAIIFSCRPLKHLWDGSAAGRCNVTERTVIIYIQGGKLGVQLVPFILRTPLIELRLVMAAGYDVILASAPVLLLWKVQIKQYEKVSLCGLFALGLL